MSRVLTGAAFLATALAITACGADATDELESSEAGKALVEAQKAFDDAEDSGTDMSTGPCISESLPGAENWVADVAHDPREPVDDDPANQCQRYASGEADHLVELDPEGNLLGAE